MATLYDIYQSQGKALPKTAEARFADPQFAAAAQQAGISKDQYAVNQGNAIMNTQIANLYGKAPNNTTTSLSSTTSNATSTPVAPTPAQVYKNINAPTGTFEDPNIAQARNEQLNYLNSLSNVDENKTYQDTLAKFQAEIDATNKMYADELARAQVAGRGRLGSQTAIAGRRGLIGSDFGESQIQGQETANENVYSSIENERLAKVNQILSQAKQDATAEIRAKREAYLQGLDARLEYYKQADERKANNANKAVASLIAQGVTPKEIDPAQLKQLASYYGISIDDITQNYDIAKKAEEDKNKKDIRGFELSQGQSRYEYDPTTGQYKQVASVEPKPVSDTLTPYQQFSATQSIAKDTQARTANAREMARQASLIQSSYDNILNGGDRSLNTQAIITSFNKILDPTSVVRESEYDRTAEGQALIDRLRGKVDNITKGGAGVTQQTLKEAADIAKTYLESSQRSINEQNMRAEQMAAQFGLNPSFVTTGSSNYNQTGTNTGPTTVIKTKVGNLDLSTW